MMRTLLNKLELLEATLTPAQIVKYPERFATFLAHIRAGKSFFNEKDDKEVILDPSEADRFEQMKAAGLFTGRVMGVDIEGNSWPLSGFKKTSDFGGASSKPGDGENDEDANKEGVLVKPSQIGITDKFIPATALASEIINNSVLLSTEYGKAVIGMAQNISNGVPATINKATSKGVTKAIVDYAGEYLGVLALIMGQSNFPKRKEFLEWLGGNVSALQLNFPAESNTPLADSYAAIIDPTSNKQINISSKGTGGGAAPSLSSIVIPDHVKHKKAYQTVVDLIELCQNDSLPKPKTVSQVFQAMNLLHERVPTKIPKDFKNFLPWPESIIDQVNASLKGKGTVPLPKYSTLTSKVGGKGTDGGKLTYVVKAAVMKIVNEDLPEFQAAVLEILDYNFIQQYTEIEKKTGTLKFYTQWPAKLDGVVTMETKSGTTDPTKGGFSFKLKPKGSKAEDPQYEPDTAAEVDSDTETKVDKIMKGHVSIKPPGSVSRERRPNKEISAPRQKR
jgi:hypothetical protein